MRATVISIGDEILIGQTINTNASFIGESLTQIGYEVVRIIDVGDSEEEILKTFDYAASISDVINVTGGLGPTHDDITTSCILKYFSTELVFDEKVFENIKEIFSRRKFKMPEVNKNQAMVPKAAKVLENKLGTAPGFRLTKGEKVFFFTPGVPFEMRYIYENHILPELSELIKKKNIFYKQKNILTTGIPESSLFELLGDINELIEDTKLAFLPSPMGVKLRLSARGENEQELIQKIERITQKIYSKAGDFIYGEGNITLEENIADLLIKNKLTLSTAESCTGGLIANRFTNIPGSSAFFERGVVCYSNKSKTELLGVNPETIEKFGAVSEETAAEMAEGIRKISGTDYGLSITGIMGPTGATETKPLGLVYVGVAGKQGVVTRKYQFGDNRIRNKERASQSALSFLRKNILSDLTK